MGLMGLKGGNTFVGNENGLGREVNERTAFQTG